MLSVVCVLLMSAVTVSAIPSTVGCKQTAQKFYTTWKYVGNFSVFAEGVILEKLLVAQPTGHHITERSASLTCTVMSAYCQFLKEYYPEVYARHEVCLGFAACKSHS